MSYPSSLDSLPHVNPGDSIDASHENAQTDAINAIETALGTNPFGSYVTVAAALAGKLDLAGGNMTGNVAMGTHKLTGVGDPTSAQDAATKNYVDSLISFFNYPGPTGVDNNTNASTWTDLSTNNYTYSNSSGRTKTVLAIFSANVSGNTGTDFSFFRAYASGASGVTVIRYGQTMTELSAYTGTTLFVLFTVTTGNSATIKIQGESANAPTNKAWIQQSAPDATWQLIGIAFG